jgi:hypothetical protein
MTAPECYAVTIAAPIIDLSGDIEAAKRGNEREYQLRLQRFKGSQKSFGFESTD